MEQTVYYVTILCVNSVGLIYVIYNWIKYRFTKKKDINSFMLFLLNFFTPMIPWVVKLEDVNMNLLLLFIFLNFSFFLINLKINKN
ncbi:hypothetical protein P40081_01805 [Paenibacillus sp. FSL P4-0081]|nr:hypothetical protein P40081_01805 [Paenibacillus sp. FSL P4-0081]OMF29588.1 hypothetical protein BK132_11080 [Paenibacillus sp. FSL H8-0259]